jgi:hypothetical protein
LPVAPATSLPVAPAPSLPVAASSASPSLVCDWPYTFYAIDVPNTPTMHP